MDILLAYILVRKMEYLSLQNSMGTVIGKELGICVHWETLTWMCFGVLGRLGWDLREKPLEGTLRV